MAGETYSSLLTTVIKEEKGLEMDFDGLALVKHELLHPDEAGGLAHVKEETFVKQEEELLIRDEAGGLTHVKQETFVKQEEELLIPDEDSSTVPSFLQSDDSNTPSLDFVMDEQDLESHDTSLGDDVPSGRNKMEKKTMEAGGLAHVKEETFVKQEEELLIPDEAGWLTHVTQETFVKEEEELPVADEDSSDVPSFLQSNDSNPPGMDFVISEQDLESYDSSSADNVLSEINKIENKRKEGAKDSFHRGEKSHQCSYCDYKAVTLGALIKHINARHPGEKAHQCPHCDYKSVTYRAMKKHIMARHTGEKYHQCPHCDYKSVESVTLKKHIMVRHTGEKAHRCSYCDYKSVTSGAMKKHIMARHTGEKAHQCPHCDYKSVTSGALKKHIMGRHTGEKPHQCPHCDYKSVRSGAMKKHIMSHDTGE